MAFLIGAKQGSGMQVYTDCKYFRGDIPCSFHKEDGSHCETCNHYRKINKRILIIKLKALGDVIRTTPLLRKLVETYPDSEITWLTDFPEAVPASYVKNTVTISPQTIPWLISTRFDLLYNLDKDPAAIGIASLVQAEQKFGFTNQYGKCIPVDEKAESKWLTGLFDDVNKANKTSYPQEIFEICGFEFKGEKYLLEVDRNKDFNILFKSKVIGLNTGCGEKWPTRLWPEIRWIELAETLIAGHYEVILLGGETEHQKNLEMAKASGAHYLGRLPIHEFFQLVNKTDLVVTAVSMTLHVAIALNKKVVLLNNIFNRNEFELFGLGEILEPEVDCLGCYMTDCSRECMELISAKKVASSVERILGKAGKVV